MQCCIMSMVSGSDELAMISSQYGWLTLTGGPIGCADCASANDGKDSNNSNAASNHHSYPTSSSGKRGSPERNCSVRKGAMGRFFSVEYGA